MKISIVGFGRLGKLLTHYLSQDFELVIHDKDNVVKEAKKDQRYKNYQFEPLEAIKDSQIVILCVPISAFAQSIKSIKPHLQAGSLVVDTCSVKEHPMEVMKNELPSGVEILGTHPMFGPDSASQTLWGSKLVLCPLRIEKIKLDGIKAYLMKHGIQIIETTATEHDKQISHSLILTHLIGRTLMEMKAQSMDIDTKGYRRLMRILSTVENDSWELFNDMNQYNKFAKTMQQDYLKAIRNVLGKLGP